MAEIPDCTLTTASFSLEKYHSKVRSVETLIRSLDTLLQIPCYLVIYCNPPLKNAIQQQREKHGLGHLTKLYVMEFEDLWCASLRDQVKKNRAAYWPTRDERSCAETHLITCNKADFVLQTIYSNPFNTSKFGWIDANAGEKLSNICRNYSNQSLLYLLNNITDKFHIQCLNVVNKKYKLLEHKREYYEQYRWLVCGGLFTTGQEIGIKILTRMKELIISTTKLGYGHGEEMFYLEILDEFYDDIHRSYGDYADMVNNFIKPTTNFVYIYWSLVMNFFNHGYYRECIDVCRSLLDRFDSFEIEINYDLYVRLYFVYYQCFLVTNSIKAEEVAQQIRAHYRANPYFANQFRNLRDLCGMNQFLL